MTPPVPHGPQSPQDPRDLAASLGAAWAPVAAFLATAVTACEYVSPRRPARHVNGAFRLDLADGRRVKLRLQRAPGQSLRVHDTLAAFDDPCFPRVLFRHRNLLVEEWVDGMPLAPDDADAPAEAGDLLGRLHTWRRFRDAPLDATLTTAGDRERLGQHLLELRDAGHLTAAAAAALGQHAAHHDPGTTALGLVHGDLCGENMLRDTSGRLRVIDNERMGPAAVIHDLARLHYRWPLSPRGRADFEAAYAGHRDTAADADEMPFWVLRTLVQSAHVRAVRWAGDAAAPLAALAALLDGAPASDAAGAGS